MQIQKRHTQQLLAAVIDTIDILSDGLFETLVVAGTDAADIELGARGSLGHAQVRDEFAEISNLVDVAGTQAGSIHHADGQWYIGKRLFTLLGSDDDFIEHSRRLFCGPALMSRTQQAERNC